MGTIQVLNLKKQVLSVAAFGKLKQNIYGATYLNML